VVRVIDRRCTGCRLCEQACGWQAIYVEPPYEALKKRLYEAAEAATTSEA
jgi:Fe-S-cluster-containing dehydrogenase component